MDITILDIDWHWDRHCQCWVTLLRISDWHLFYLEMEAKHSGGGVALLTIAGVRIV